MIKLPWDSGTVPHCVIEITHRCNIACKACYRQKTDMVKTIGQVAADIEVISKHQAVHTVSLAGGEPTLHPDLCEIVRWVKRKGFRASLVTNGVVLTDALLDSLKKAGLDVVMVHVDEGQQRPDLGAHAGIEEINALRRRLTDRAAAHGLDAGLCATIYRESIANLPSLVECVLASQNINYLFATHAVEIPEVVRHAGITPWYENAPTKNSHVMEIMQERFGLESFAFIPARSADAREHPCISYYVPVAHAGAQNDYLRLSATGADYGMIRLTRAATGRYLYYCRQNPLLIGMQILINGIARSRFREAASFLGRAVRGKGRLRAKRLVFENAPVIDHAGRINCCTFCPNSTVRNGRVVPVCLADHACST